jgi:hypothetical protein
MVRGDGITDTNDDIDRRNVDHAVRQQDCTVDDTVALLEHNGALLEAALRGLSAGDLDQVAPFGPAGGQPFPAGDFAAVCAGHARGHFGHAKAAVSDR